MISTLIIFIFWLSLAVVAYTFLGYPALIAGLARLRPVRSPARADSTPPTVTVVLAAHNEAARIAARLKNLLASDYPAKQLNVVVVADGCTDHTIAQIQSLDDPRVQLIVQLQRQGKAAALNLALAAVRSELIVFADVRQTFAPDAIAQLAGHFSDPQTGAVSGELLINPAASAVGGGVDVYWRLEKFIRHAEARWDSSIGCTGAIYAIRRELFQPLPANTILDDVVIPMRLAVEKYRVGFEPNARAFDPQTLEPGREQIRKRRTLAGNYQMLCRYPHWLLPWHNRLWWQLLSHKYLRLAAPFLLTLLFVSNALLLAIDPYDFLFYGQCAFYALAICGLLLPSKNVRLLSLPAGFVFLNWMSLTSLWHYLRDPDQTGWQTTKSGTHDARPQTPNV